ncbi:MAG: efflux RND transporter periplasmic adaptor subunit [Deltaproteobacteria bacterium]|nr:efflux RND transporter periplasmic adaptor subunit [Deltaproteobacteria bacterium]
MLKISNYLVPILAALILPPLAAQAGPMGPGRPPTVIVAKIGQADVAPTARYVGHVEAVQTVDLRARVEGFLEQIKFKEGDFVRAGDILFIIEQSAYKARVAADEAGVARNRAELNRAGSYLKRLKSANREAIPATDMDNAIAADLTAKANLAKAQADLTLARLDLSYTTVKAPISGRIGRTNYTVGNLVNPAAGPLARIVQVDPVRVLYSISENDLGAVQAAIRGKGNFSGLLAPRLKLANGRPYALAGRLDFIDNEVDAATGTIAIRAKFPNPGGVLIPGQYVTVILKTATPKIMPIVPQAAVLNGKDGRFVLTVRHGIASPRPITTGTVVGSYWAVKSGLKTGDEIIVSGIQKVRPGMPVTVTQGMEKKR